MIRGRLLLLAVVLPAMAAAAAPGPTPTAGTARLSWGYCDPQITNAYLPGTPAPRIFNLVLSAMGITEVNSGTDFTLVVWPDFIGLPDAWRFDDAGCQTAARISFLTAAVGKTCPPMQAGTSWLWTDYGADPIVGRGIVRLRARYYPFAPHSTTRYALWQIKFDHSRSDLVPPVEADSCAGSLVPVCIDIMEARLLLPSGRTYDFSAASGYDWRVHFNVPVGWTCGLLLVPSSPGTWGRVKAIYR